MLRALIAIFALSQPQPLVSERCDCIEVNHVFNCRDQIDADWNWSVEKRYRLTAIIFWDGPPWKIRDWRWGHMIEAPGPTVDGEWSCEWEERGVIRRVTAPEYVESYTTYDVELRERKFSGRRRGLKVPLAEVER